jgi:hypothetical protein
MKPIRPMQISTDVAASTTAVFSAHRGTAGSHHPQSRRSPARCHLPVDLRFATSPLRSHRRYDSSKREPDFVEHRRIPDELATTQQHPGCCRFAFILPHRSPDTTTRCSRFNPAGEWHRRNVDREEGEIGEALAPIRPRLSDACRSHNCHVSPADSAEDAAWRG